MDEKKVQKSLKRMLAITLALVVLTTCIFLNVEEKRAYATAAVAGGVGYITGEAIGSLIISALMLAGIYEDFDIDEVGLFTESTSYIGGVAADGRLSSMSLPERNPLAVDVTVNDFDGYCSALADKFNACFDAGVDLLGNALDYSDLDQQFIVGDEGSNVGVASPGLFNAIVDTLDEIFNEYIHDRNTQAIPGMKGMQMNLEYDLSTIDWVELGTTYEDMIALIGDCNYVMGYSKEYDTFRICYAPYPLTIGGEYPDNYYSGWKFDESELAVKDRSWNYVTLKKGDIPRYGIQSPTGVIDSTSIFGTYETIAYTGLVSATAGKYSLPLERDIFDEKSRGVPIAVNPDGTLSDVFDRDDSFEKVQEMVIVPDLDKLLELYPDVIWDMTGAASADEVNEKTKDFVSSLADTTDLSREAADVLGLEKPDNDKQAPTVTTGWGWLDGILNKILQVLYDIWNAITGLAQTIINGLINGIKSILEALFVPSDGFLDSIVAEASGHFNFYDGLLVNIRRFSDFFTGDVGTKAPVIVVDLSDKEFGPAYGGKVVISFAWYARYKPIVDTVISAFLWGVFIWNTFKSVPSIISGIGDYNQATAEIKEREGSSK